MPMAYTGNNIDRLRKQRNMTLRELAERAGISLVYLQQVKAGTGKRRLNTDLIDKLAAALGCEPSELIGGPTTPESQSVPVVGYVGAGAEVFWFGEEDVLDEVSMPFGAEPGQSFKALRVKGDSQAPLLPEGSIIYCDASQEKCTDCSIMIGELCVVQIKNGPMLLKYLNRGYQPGRFNLMSSNATAMEDQELDWCMPCRHFTRHLVRR